MGLNTNPDHHNDHAQQSLSAEEIQALQVSQTEQKEKPAFNPKFSKQRFLNNFHDALYKSHTNKESP